MMFFMHLGFKLIYTGKGHKKDLQKVPRNHILDEKGNIPLVVTAVKIAVATVTDRLQKVQEKV